MENLKNLFNYGDKVRIANKDSYYFDLDAVVLKLEIKHIPHNPVIYKYVVQINDKFGLRETFTEKELVKV